QGEISPIAAYSLDPKAYASAEFVPQEIASLVRIGETRGAFFGNLLVRPLQYNPLNQILRKYTRIIVRVDFGEPEAPIRQATGARGLALNDDAFEVNQPQHQEKKTILRNSVLSSGIWYRFTVNEDGMYKLTGQMLLDAGIPLSTDPRTISIYGNGGYETPMAISATYVDDLVQNAVYVNDGGTPGQLDPSDYIIFFGKTTRGWNYNPASKTFSHYINHFTEANVYWLTYGGSNKLMTEVPSLNQPMSFRPTTVKGKLFRKDDKVNLLSSGLEWLGQPINADDQITYVHSLPGLDNSQPIKYVFDVAARSAATSTFTISEHGNSLVSTLLPGSLFGDYPYQISERVLTVVQAPTFTGEQSQLRFSFVNSDAASNGYVRWYELFYPRFLTAQNDLFNFHAADTNAVAEYSITGFSGGQILVFDVTKYDSVLSISSPQISADTCRFQLGLNSGSARELYVVGGNGFKSPGSLIRTANQNLHGDPNEAPYIIITNSEFMSAAQRLKAYREQPGANYLKTLVVDVDQIYNEFGGGLLSPAAIRNYLRYVYLNWSSPPQYVLFFGDGDFDYKNIIVSNPNWIPPWESPQSFDPLATYAEEGAYVSFFDGNRVDLGLGRLTARSLQEANTVVDKIIEYETRSVNDPWKIRTTFVADDGLEAPGRNNGFAHTNDQENASRLVPSLFEKKKIYLYEYPTVFTAGGRRKPAVNQAIRDQITQGTLMLNFAGHGNPRVWTHEGVFVRETDIPLLHNKGKYFFLVAATCNYSHFDMLTDQSSGELLVSMPDAGAIATFSANRPVYAAENALLNQILCRNLFTSDSVGRVLPKRLGDVIFQTLQEGTFDPNNDKKYFLLGDPALRIAFPTLT
ncbi:MAG: type IX secretion system sortase PorU, partial [Ignavibacteriales bacterium]|nr:type IX secretion system sortase PorU [Ignavibacteriales bacterium]